MKAWIALLFLITCLNTGVILYEKYGTNGASESVIDTAGETPLIDRDEKFADIAAFYGSLSAAELSMRFAHPELYEGRDDFARSNALSEMLERKLIRRGLTTRQVTTYLGRPNYNPKGITIGKPFEFHYDGLTASRLEIFFGPDERVSRILRAYDHPKPSIEY